MPSNTVDRSGQRNHKWSPILVGTDGSEGAARAVDAAGALAADLKTDLQIAYVIDGTSETALTQLARAEETSKGDVTKEMARRILDDAMGRAEAGGARQIRTTLRAGDCADELVAAAHKAGSTAIFVGRRGAGGRLKESLMGSVSQKLAGVSPITLVIVP